MGYFEFADSKSGGDCHRAHEGIQGANGYEGLNYLTAKCFQCATRIAQSIPKSAAA